MLVRRTLAFPFLVSLLWPTLALATLGERAETVQADQARMRASLRMMRAETYTVHELQSANGTTIREFVSPSGMVFGVAWEGQALPDLRQLLGRYFDQYQRVRQHGRGPRRVESQGLVVQVGGHQRSLSGRAYLSDMLPEGARAEDVR